MDKIGTFNTASAFNTNTATATRESDLRSSKRRRRGAATEPAADEPQQEEFSGQQYISFAGAGDVLDPALANLNKDLLKRDQAVAQPDVQQPDSDQQNLIQEMRGISGLMLEQLAASYRDTNNGLLSEDNQLKLPDEATEPDSARRVKRTRQEPASSNADGQLLQALPLATATGGSFTNEEILTLDRFMEFYKTEHGLDDAELRRRVWANERKKDNFWDAVASALPMRSRASVYKHVRRRYHPYEQRAKWTSQEDDELRQLVELNGAQWKTIGRQIGRMPEDCRDRWRNYVKCGANRGQNKWNAMEETRLLEIVNQIRFNEPGADINWTVVSERMGGIRSRIQCRYKWKKLNRGLDSN